MTDTIDAASPALDLPAPIDLPRATQLPPPVMPMPQHAEASVDLPAPAGLITAPPAPAIPEEDAPNPEEDAPSLTTGPSSIFAADAAMLPAEHAAPALPSVPAVAAVAAAATPVPTPGAGTAFDVGEFLADAQGNTKKSVKKSPGRWITRLLLVGLLGGGAWLGVNHGPALYDQYVAGNEPGTSDEVEAPLAFPQVTIPLAPVRTAEFVLVGLPETPGSSYRVTTDFETDVSQVDITRETAPDLQVLTYGNDAMIRRADSAQWYLLERGQFPLDDRLDRENWVRRLDELLPTNVRQSATIARSSESMISGVPTRHLTLSVAPGLLHSANVADVPASPDTDEATPTAPADPVGAAVAPEVAPVPSPDMATPTDPNLIEIEIWVDGEGLVRQVSGAPQLGAETITVVRTSADAWIPDYPAPEAISTLTASALVNLGI